MTDSTAAKAPLEDLMAAMDVVDTLRHQQGLVARELDGEARRGRLLERLRELYKAQGIEVPDHVLQEGIDALEEERFAYRSVTPSWRTRLASVWISRRTWGKPLGFLTLLGGLFLGIYVATDVLPEQRLQAQLPVSIGESVERITQLADDPGVVDRARQQALLARQSLQSGEATQAAAILETLQSTEQTLRQEYRIRVVSRDGESSGVWRVPPNNQQARNYYLIVEAVDTDNRVLALDVVSEESNVSKRVKTWGVRVSEEVFYRVAADKQDDGIIQANQIGSKQAGFVRPDYSIPTEGGTITEW